MYLYNANVKFKDIYGKTKIGIVKGEVGDIISENIEDARSPYTCCALLIKCVDGVGHEFDVVDSLSVEVID